MREPAIGRVPSAAPATAASLPLDAYVYGHDQQRVLHQAEQLLLQTCMRRKGFDYQVVPWQPPPDNAAGRAARYGVTDPELARKYGYHSPLAADKESKSNAFITKTPPSSDYLKAYLGFERPPASGAQQRPGGCVGEVAGQLDKGVPQADLNLPGDLAAQAADRTAADSRVGKVVGSWRACMARSGFEYATPWEAQSAAWPEKPSASEIETAEADVRCKKNVNLVGVWFAVESAYQRSYVARNESALGAVKEAGNERVRRAQAVLRGER